MPISPDVVLLAHDPGELTVGHVRNTLVIHWRATPTKRPILHLAACTTRILDTYGQLASLQVVHNGVAVPDAEARSLLRQFTRNYDGKFAAVVYALQREGFGGSMLRSVITSALMALPTPFPLGIELKVADAAHWLEATLRKRPQFPPVSAAALIQAAEHLGTHEGPAVKP